MRIAVTGHQGQVAQSLLERAPRASVDVITIGRPEIDLAEPTGVEATLRAGGVDAVISAAAYTAVDLAESEPAIAESVNVGGAGAVAHAAHILGIPVVHLSTDYVFDGKLDRAYREDDAVGPASVYGRTKLDGERAVAAANPNHAILRTAWVYSPFGKNFARTMLRLAITHDEIPVVADQHGTPTNALDIADAAIAVATHLKTQQAAELRGVFHMTSGGEATWADFAEAIFAASRRIGGPSARVVRISSSAYLTPAQRPANSRLDISRLATIHAVRLPHWQDTLPLTIARLVAQEFQGKTSS